MTPLKREKTETVTSSQEEFAFGQKPKTTHSFTDINWQILVE